MFLNIYTIKKKSLFTEVHLLNTEIHFLKNTLRVRNSLYSRTEEQVQLLG